MSGRSLWLATIAAALLAACHRNPPAAAVAPQGDSTALRARADSLAAASRRDSLAALARADSTARADSAARRRALAARADSVRAQVGREGGGAAPAATPWGLDAGRTETMEKAVYFDFDKFDLKPETVEWLDRKLEILRANPRLEILIEGHCDERGSDEYNLALGNRRAAAVQRYLIEHGIGEDRISIISYGEERPADPGHNEEAWAKNRRAEFRPTRGAR